MNYPAFKTSSLFRGRGSKRALVAWFAVLVQLNIFVVLELHHHVLGSLALTAPASQSTGAAWRPSGTAPARSPLCPACQIARQGSVQPAVQGLSTLALPAFTSAVPASPSSLPVIFLLHSSGRDPPRS